MSGSPFFILLLAATGCRAPSTEDTPRRPHRDDTAAQTDSTPTDTTGTTETGDTAPPAVSLPVAPSDPALRYVGRWDFTDPEAPRVGWQGPSVALRFDGTGATVRLAAGTEREFVRVVVDGDELGSRRFYVSPEEDEYVVVEGLSPGAHEVELVKETSAGVGFTFYGFVVTGQQILEAPPTATRHIELYGDSGLAGSSMMSEHNEGGWNLVGAWFSYGAVAARALGADAHTLAVSGETLASMTEHYNRRDYSDPKPNWDFGDYPADVVVLDLGSNDIYAPESEVRARYARMLGLLRGAHPTAHIVLFNSYGWDYDEAADYSAEVVADFGDPNVSAAWFPWFFEQWHGCEYDHGGMARYLIAHLESVMGWESTEPVLMSGYGLGGDVANGDFEETAPFGGYGWRYADGEGVERVEDGTAYSGERFVRLTDGGTIHQPNPAAAGDAIAVTIWARGAEEGDTATFVVDFRDQQMGSPPSQVETRTFALTTDWMPYTVTSVAPSLTNNPVFHTRLTLTAGAGSVVDVDAIGMVTE